MNAGTLLLLQWAIFGMITYAILAYIQSGRRRRGLTYANLLIGGPIVWAIFLAFCLRIAARRKEVERDALSPKYLAFLSATLRDLVDEDARDHSLTSLNPAQREMLEYHLKHLSRHTPPTPTPTPTTNDKASTR